MQCVQFAASGSLPAASTAPLSSAFVGAAVGAVVGATAGHDCIAEHSSDEIGNEIIVPSGEPARTKETMLERSSRGSHCWKSAYSAGNVTLSPAPIKQRSSMIGTLPHSPTDPVPPRVPVAAREGAVRQRPAEACGGGHVHVRWMLDTMDESGAFEGVARDWNAHVGVFGDLVGKR